MSLASVDTVRMKVLLIATHEKPQLAKLKRTLRKWNFRSDIGQHAINLAIVNAIDEIQTRLDALIRI